jgi:hypothetical protein
MEERHRAEGARSYEQPKTPTQDELRANTREFGGEMNDIRQLTEQVANLVRTLAPALANLEHIAANGNGNGNGRQHSQPWGRSTPPINEPAAWPYGGIDTARDHRLLREEIRPLQLGMLELQSAVLGIPSAILRLESRIMAHIDARVDFALNRQAA